MERSLDVLYTSLQGRYAKALFIEGLKAQCVDEIRENFEKLETFFKASRILKKFLTTNSMNSLNLNYNWAHIAEHLKLCPIFLNFVRLVTENGRFDLFYKIKYIYERAYAKCRGIRNVTVYSVIELKVVQRRQLEKLIAKFFSEKVAIKYEIDVNLLGGVKIVSDGKVIDASVATQIRQLENFCGNMKLERVYEN